MYKTQPQHTAPSTVHHQLPATKVVRPSDAEAHAALDRVVSSSRFRASLRLTAFLRHVVERTLAGRDGEIKSYTIAVEALGRDPSFEPEANPIVRVEAGRLRQALALYYGSTGSGDPVIIELPRGSYVPLFHWRMVVATDRPHEPSALQVLLGRLAALHRELAAVSAEVARMLESIAQSKLPPAARD
jgi:hypothetical protein